MLVSRCGHWETGPEGQVKTNKLCLLLSWMMGARWNVGFVSSVIGGGRVVGGWIFAWSIGEGWVWWGCYGDDGIGKES